MLVNPNSARGIMLWSPKGSGSYARACHAHHLCWGLRCYGARRVTRCNHASECDDAWRQAVQDMAAHYDGVVALGLELKALMPPVQEMDAQYEEALETRRQQLAEQAQRPTSAASAAPPPDEPLPPQGSADGMEQLSAGADVDHDPRASLHACQTPRFLSPKPLQAVCSYRKRSAIFDKPFFAVLINGGRHFQRRASLSSTHECQGARRESAQSQISGD